MKPRRRCRGCGTPTGAATLLSSFNEAAAALPWMTLVMPNAPSLCPRSRFNEAAAALPRMTMRMWIDWARNAMLQ